MIVTCDACKTSFKVDDSRIPPKGIMVRCSKCKHVFMVRPEIPDDFLSEFDNFQRFHKDQMKEEAPAKEERADTIDEKPAHIPEEEMVDVTDEKPAYVPEEPAGISFEEFMSKEEPAPQPSEAESPAEELISREFEQPEEPSQEEVVSEEIDLQPPPPSEPSEVTGVIPEETSTEKEEAQLSIEEFFKEEMEREPEDQVREEVLPSLKDKKFKDLIREKGLRKGPVRRRSSFRAILFLILLLTLGVAAYFLWHNQGAFVSLPVDIGPTFKTAVKTAVEKVSGLWDDVLKFRKGGLELSSLQGYEDEIGQHRIYVIKGNVTNKSRRAKKYVKLRVIILDQVGNRIKEKVIFCGNVFTREELEKLSPKFLTGDEILQPKKPKDMVVEGHKGISFMAIFSGLPREGKSFKVEIIEAPGV